MQNGLVRMVIDRKEQRPRLSFIIVSTAGKPKSVTCNRRREPGRARGGGFSQGEGGTGAIIPPARRPPGRIAIRSGHCRGDGDGTGQFKIWCFDTEAHQDFAPGRSWIFLWLIKSSSGNGPGMPGIPLAQARAVMGAGSGTNLFTHYLVDDQRQDAFPTGPILETVQ